MGVEHPSAASAARRQSETRWGVFSYCLVVMAAALFLATFLDYGMTFDEWATRLYGDLTVAWYASLFKDTRVLDNSYTHLFYLYGSFFDVVAQLATRLPLHTSDGSALGVFETRHLVNTMFGLLAIITAYRLGRQLAGARAGFFAALFLLLTPRFYGHLYNNPKDVPFATLYLLSVYYLLWVVKELPDAPRSLYIKLGVASGLTLGVRIGGVLLFGFMAVGVLGWLVVIRFMRRKDAKRPIGVRLGTVAGRLLGSVVIAWCVMLACWPWAQTNPVAGPFKALRDVSKFPWVHFVWFGGRPVMSTELPWTYLPAWFAISLPEFYFVTLGVGVVMSAVFFWRVDRNLESWLGSLRVFILCLAAGLPVGTAIVMRATLYNGMRHFLFVVPPLAVLAAVAFDGLMRSGSRPALKRLVGMAVAVSLSITVADMIRLHPYQSVYFNRLIGGGLANAAKGFETDYWGASYREGAEWVAAHYRGGGQRKVRVANCSLPILTGYFLDKSTSRRERFQTVLMEENPDVYLCTESQRLALRASGLKLPAGKQVHAVRRFGVPLLWVFETSGMAS